MIEETVLLMALVAIGTVVSCASQNLQPQRVLFQQNFESEGDWDGQVVTDNVPAGSRRALEGYVDNRYFARFIRVGIRDNPARATAKTWIRFWYYLSMNTSLEVMLFDLTQGDNYAAQVTEPTVGKWTEMTMQIADRFRRKDGSDAFMEAGDEIDDIFFGAGKSGDQNLQLLVDDVRLLGLD